MRIAESNIDSLWTSTIWALSEHGAKQESRNGGSIELIGTQLVLTDPSKSLLKNPVRKLSHPYAAAEFAWYLSGERRIDRLLEYAPSYSKFAEDGIAHGAYGERWFREDQYQWPQIPDLIEILKSDPNSRQAVLSCWFPTDLNVARSKGAKDIPCTLTLQFLIRNNALHLITTMRSNDVWLGLPYDVFCFTGLQTLVADILRCDLGTYTHNVGSLHLYDKDAPKAWSAIEEDVPVNMGFLRDHDPKSLGFLPDYERLSRKGGHFDRPEDSDCLRTWCMTVFYDYWTAKLAKEKP